VLDLIVLGVVQGLTEYLPVSSTAHLLFAEHFLGICRPGLSLEAILHLGTVVAAVVMFWPDVLRLLRGAFTLTTRTMIFTGRATRARFPDPYERVAALIIAATVVTAVLGLLFRHPLEQMFSSVRGTAYQLIITGVLLLFSRERGDRTVTEATLPDGAALGAAQALAIIPGISRSGTTIVTGLALGLRRTEATRLSFLMAIPVITGASVLELADFRGAAGCGITTPQLVLGFVVSAVVGAAAIRWLMEIVRRGRLIYFAVYCWVAGVVVILATMR